MKPKALAFRLHPWVLLAIYLIGFLAPWESRPATTLWLAASTWLARVSPMDLAASTLAVTVAALFCCLAAAVLSTWSAAYIGVATIFSSTFHGPRLVADGPYRYLRNPLYLANCLLALGVSILMTPTGAFVFWAAFFLFHRVLVSAEEEFLSESAGEAWREYCARVPRFVPRLATPLPATEARPCWLQALLAEIYPVGFTVCFAIFAWRYNALLLIKCLIICYGLSLIARAFQTPRAIAFSGGRP